MPNSITIVGRLGKDPETSVTKIGKNCCKFSVAEDIGKDKDGANITQWYNCVAFERTGELIAQYFSKGKPIFVTGNITGRLYAKQDGTAGLSLDVKVDSFQFIPFGEKKPGAGAVDDPADPEPPTGYHGKPDASGVDDITDPFADQ